MLIAILIVAAITILLRIPSCFESFWVDELHTAWTIHDDLADVASRARIGHQQPYYFTLLWLWRQVFGDGELALRLTSVLAVAGAGVALTLGVARATQSTLAGFAAGMFLAIESNSIFFGTELRPYAAVMLASAVGCCFAQQSWNTRPADRGVVWFLVFVALGIAAVMQLTSLGILAWLPIAIVARWCWLDWRSVVWPKRVDVVVMLVVIATAALIMPSRVLETWNTRSIWASFASTRYIDDLWELWPWLVGLVLPAVWFVLNNIVDRAWYPNRDRSHRNASFTVVLAFVLVGSTFLLWLVSYTELAPLWHRRFMIAGLPMLAWCFGVFVASGAGQGRAGKGRAVRQLPAAIVTITLLVMLASWSQTTLTKLLHAHWQLVSRREDWRAAIAYLNSHASIHDNDVVAIDPGLIEQIAWHQEIVTEVLTHEQSKYLSYPLRGPYPVPCDANVVASNLLPTDHWIPSHDRSWIISRQRAGRLRQAIQRRVGTESITVTVRSFGGVSVASIEARKR